MSLFLEGGKPFFPRPIFGKEGGEGEGGFGKRRG